MTQPKCWGAIASCFLLVIAVVATSACHAQITNGATYVPAESYDQISCLAFSPDGEKLLVGNDNGLVEVFQPSSRRRVGSFFAMRFLSELLFSPKGDVVAGYSSKRDDIFLLDAKNWKPLPSLRTLDHGVVSIVIAPNGQYLAAACNDGTLLLWDLPARKLVNKTKWERKREEEPCIQFSPDSKTLVSACGPIDFSDVKTCRRIMRIAEVPSKDNPDPIVCSLAFRPNGKVLFSAESDWGGENGKIRMWDVATGRMLHTLEWKYGDGQSAVYSLIPVSGDMLVTACCTECTIRLWDTRTFKEIGTFHPGANVSNVVMSPNGEMLAAQLFKIDWDTWKVWRLTDVFPVLKDKKGGRKKGGAHNRPTSSGRKRGQRKRRSKPAGSSG